MSNFTELSEKMIAEIAAQVTVGEQNDLKGKELKEYDDRLQELRKSLNKQIQEIDKKTIELRSEKAYLEGLRTEILTRETQLQSLTRIRDEAVAAKKALDLKAQEVNEKTQAIEDITKEFEKKKKEAEIREEQEKKRNEMMKARETLIQREKQRLDSFTGGSS